MLCATVTGALMSACSPALDWRDVQPEGSGWAALFPCQPKRQSRDAALAGAATPMTLHSCSADGLNFAISHADLGEPSRVSPALRQMAAALASNLQAGEVRSAAWELGGMTPNPDARRLWLAGSLPDGTAMQEQAALFVRGTRVYQAAVLGTRVDEAAAGAFFDSLRLLP